MVVAYPTSDITVTFWTGVPNNDDLYLNIDDDASDTDYVEATSGNARYKCGYSVGLGVVSDFDNTLTLKYRKDPSSAPNPGKMELTVWADNGMGGGDSYGYEVAVINGDIPRANWNTRTYNIPASKIAQAKTDLGPLTSFALTIKSGAAFPGTNVHVAFARFDAPDSVPETELRATTMGVEVLSGSPGENPDGEEIRVTTAGAEVLAFLTANEELRCTTVGAEVLGFIDPFTEVRCTTAGAEVLSGLAQETKLFCTVLSAEVMALPPVPLSTAVHATVVGSEVMHHLPIQTELLCTVAGVEIFAGRGYEETITPLPLPSRNVRALPINWITRVSMRTSYVTDVLEGRFTGWEEAIQFLSKPYRVETVQFTAITREDAQRLEANLQAYITSDNQPFPIFCDQLEVNGVSPTQTVFDLPCPDFRFHENGRAALFYQNPGEDEWNVEYSEILGKSNFVVELKTGFGVSADFGLIFPCMDILGKEDIQCEVTTDHYWQTTITVREQVGPSALIPFIQSGIAFNLYRNDIILNVEPNWFQGHQMSKEFVGLSFRSGLKNIVQTSEFNRTIFEITYSGDRTTTFALLSFFNILKARRGNIWILNLLSFFEPVYLDANTLRIEKTSNILDLDAPFIGIKTANATYISETSGPALEFADYFEFSLIDPLPPIALTSIVACTTAHLCKNTRDYFEESWVTTTACEDIVFSFREILSDDSITTLGGN